MCVCLRVCACVRARVGGVGGEGWNVAMVTKDFSDEYPW